MRKIVAGILALALLAGCQAAPQETTGPETTQAASGTALLDQAEAVNADENLFYIPNAHVESMACPEIRLYGNGLLLYELGMNGGMKLVRISLEDGSLQAEASYPVSPAAKVQIGSGLIAICDNGTGQVLLLNESLQVETTYTIPADGAEWQLDQEFETLYAFYSEQGLQSRDLATGQTRWILENTAYLWPVGAGNGYVLFSYTDRADQKTYVRCLNLSTGNMETVPVEGAVQSGLRSGDQWLLRRDAITGEYTLIDQETVGVFAWPEGTVALLSGRRQLMVTDADYRNLFLYDLDGKFRSRCSLPQIEYATVGTDLVWSGYWEGYFFRDTYDNAAHLMFWDPSVPQEGEPFTIAPMGEAQKSDPVVEQSLYEKAADMSQRYGLDIRIAEQCALEYDIYLATMFKDSFFLREALDTLDEALSKYPEGFFQQLLYDNIDRIQIELVMDVVTRPGEVFYQPTAGGFADLHYDHYLIVLDAMNLKASTVYHEFSHVIDKRLEWDARLRPEAMYSEEAWLSYQPEGFRYAESYVDMPADVAAFEDSGYFVRSYGMTFPTEDRATLMALAIDEPVILEHHPHMVEKMRFYAACIRDCFDTTLWPAETAWE